MKVWAIAQSYNLLHRERMQFEIKQLNRFIAYFKQCVNQGAEPNLVYTGEREMPVTLDDQARAMNLSRWSPDEQHPLNNHTFVGPDPGVGELGTSLVEDAGQIDSSSLPTPHR